MNKQTSFSLPLMIMARLGQIVKKNYFCQILNKMFPGFTRPFTTAKSTIYSYPSRIYRNSIIIASLSHLLFSYSTFKVFDIYDSAAKTTIDQKTTMRYFRYGVILSFTVPLGFMFYLTKRVRKIELFGSKLKVTNEFGRNVILNVKECVLDGEVLRVKDGKLHIPAGEYYPTEQAFIRVFNK
jgi:hypothetical protein